MSGGRPAPVKRSESQVSPKSRQTATRSDYFTIEKKGGPSSGANTPQSSSQSIASRFESAQRAVFDPKGKGKGKEATESTGDVCATTPGETGSSTGSSGPPSRKGSVSSVTFAPPRNPLLPQGLKKPHAGSRIRAASPPHRRSSPIPRAIVELVSSKTGSAHPRSLALWSHVRMPHCHLGQDRRASLVFDSRGLH
ncbi:hypothetical protein GGS23DRAFT_91943 [Durotheca rogersii]|uniref:uncharacterized protein n=1 Tax=Durotheca rogersii TaxID=419775 RepID=UPI00221F34F9|nr:uncharacterized protein GGS23DRAFT_91943 [Durotheca rogersii]KAI5862302.1 hypothetical protein GGS23DRAFT_91943 [Durotheca rogersii]